jgi:membrane protease YdiL (CAAX protease family)
VSIPVTWVFGRERLEEPARDLTGRAEGFGVALLIVLVVLCAPVIEELFFRGLVLRSIQAQYNDTLALFGSAVLFGLAHFQLLQFPAVVMFGIVSAYCAQRTGRLGMSMFAHAGFNGVSVLVLVLNR